MFFNVVGAVAWICSLGSIGYFLVKLFPGIRDHMGWVFLVLIIVTAIPIVRIVLVNRKEISKD